MQPRSKKSAATQTAPSKTGAGERINVALRNTGKATRREADELIALGKVFVNGEKATVGMRVSPTDKIEIRGKSKTYRYFVYNKPAGIVTTQPQAGEKDIVSSTKFPKVEGGKLFPIGRLDKDSTGLIIMTNDGRITDDFLSPDKQHEKEYVVTINKRVTNSFKNAMENGVTIGDSPRDKNSNKKIEKYTTKPSKVVILGDQTFSIILTEGKNRQIRRMCEALGTHVTKLERVRIGKYMLGKMKPGEWREIKM